MVAPSECNVKLNGNRCGCHIICFTLILISLSCLDKTQTVIKQAEAIISPKARVCFNSMSTSFQSECVYCDSKLYASTMTACTGQPTLANNVTQAQAFCIATACLQVPVLNEAEPMKVANQLIENYMNKLNLFRPSLLFGGARNGVQGGSGGKSWQPTSASAAASSTRTANQLKLKSHQNQKMFGFMPTIGGVSSHNKHQFISKNFLIPDSIRPYLRQEVIDIVTDVTATSDTTTTIEPPPASNSEPPRANGGGGGGVTGASVATSGDDVVNLELQLQTNAPPEQEKKPIEYPNFNEMHAKIYSNFLHINNNNNRRKFQPWRPFQQYLPSMMSNNRQQQQQHQLQPPQHLFHWTGNGRMSNLMQLFSSRLAEKRANWQTGKVPIVLGRKKRSLVLPSLSFNLNKNKQKFQNNGTVTGQLNKLVNGTTSGNLAFVLNKPSAAYIWSNPLTQLFTKNTPNKSLQWQFGKGQPVPAVPAAAGLVANPQVATFRPAALMAATSGQPAQSNQLASFRPSPLNPNRSASGGSSLPAVAPTVATAAQSSAAGSSSLMSQMGDMGAEGGSSGAGSFVVLADAAARG